MITSSDDDVCLLSVSEYGEFSCLFGLAPRIQNQLGLHPVFVFSSGYGKLEEHGQLCSASGFSWFEVAKAKRRLVSNSDLLSEHGYYHLQTSQKSGVSNANQARSPSSFRFMATFQLFNKILNRFNLLANDNKGNRSNPKTSYKNCLKLFDLVKVRIVISGQDYALSSTSFLAKIAEQRGVKVCIVPFSMVPTTKEIIENFSYLKTNKLTKFQESFLGKHNKWLIGYRGEFYSRLSFSEILFCWKHDIEPPAPWVPNSGRGILLLPSEQAKDYYERSGVSPNKLHVTGAPWNDEFVKNIETREARKQALLKRLKSIAEMGRSRRVRECSRFVLVSWPPNQWPRGAMGAQSYEDLCMQFINAIMPIQASGLAYVAVSMHPTVSNKGIIDNLRKLGIAVLQDSLTEVLDCADVFSATVSSTCFWAVQCGIPVVNFDGYLYGYTEFEKAGCITVQSATAMGNQISKLLTDDSYYQANREAIERNRDYWTLRDGKSLQRIVQYIGELSRLATDTPQKPSN